MMTQYLRTLGGRVLMPALALVALSSPVSAQLANTPWPMFQHDPQHTGRSPNLGPVFTSGKPSGPGAVTIVPLGVKIKAQPSIGSDGSIYLGVGWKFCAVSPSLAATCTDLPSDISASTAAIDVNGIVYLGDRNNSVSGFSWDGSSPPNLVCRYNYGHEGDVNTSPAILPGGTDGTIYFAGGQSRHGLGPVVAIEPAPNCGLPPVGDASGEKWFIKADTTIGSSSPAITTEGIDRVLYIGDNSGFVRKYQDCLAGYSAGSACASAGGAAVTEVWHVRIGTKVRASAVIGPDGTVFVGSSNGFMALDPATGATICPPGQSNCSATFDTGGFVTSTAAMSADGTLYVGSQSAGKKKYIFALKWSGGQLTRLWTFGPVVSEADISPFPVVGGDGVVYATIGRGVYALTSATGARLWSYTLDNLSLNHPTIAGTATASADGTGILYVTTASGRLYKFLSQRTASDLNNAPTPVPVADVSTTVGQSVHFDGAASDDPDTEDNDTCTNWSLMYSWDFGDGFTASGPCVDHTFWSPGPQTVTLTVSDGLLSDTATITVSVDGSGLASITDQFTRPDCTSPCANLGHEPAGLSNWQQEQGAFVILSGGLQNTLTKNNHIAIRPDVVGTNLSASASFTSPNNGPGPRFGLILRHQGPGNYYVMYRQAGGTNALRIAKVVNGVEALLKSVPAGNLALNVPFVMTASSTTTSGVTTLTLSLQGGGTVSVQDSTFSGGNVGLMLGTGSSGLNQYRADDFHAESN